MAKKSARKDLNTFYFFEYIQKCHPEWDEILDYLKYELDQSVYYYGGQFKTPQETIAKRRTSLHEYLKEVAYVAGLLVKKDGEKRRKRIVANAYFGIKDQLERQNYDVYDPPYFQVRGGKTLGGFPLHQKTKRVRKFLRTKTFREIISSDLIADIVDLKASFKSALGESGIDAVLVPNDLDLFSKIAIDSMKELGKKSMLFSHGLPGIYDIRHDARCDYLVVWGKQIKENFIKAGFAKDRIFVSGHPTYQSYTVSDVRSGLDDILVLSKSMPGGQYPDAVRISDRGRIIFYLYSIQRVLAEHKVKKVKLRVHPSENPEWYQKYVDNDFFILDREPLSQSLKKATLVLGPTSTVLLEALIQGINYLVYEPSESTIDLTNFALVPPFDGSDPRVPVAKTEDELHYFIKHQIKADANVLSDYIKTPFDLSFMKELV